MKPLRPWKGGVSLGVSASSLPASSSPVGGRGFRRSGIKVMPELPEVETIKQDLSRLIVGKEILEVTTDSPKQIQPSLEVVKKSVVGAKIKNVGRRAKLLQIFLDNGRILVIHLKLTGRLLVRKTGVPEDEWQHAVFKLGDGWELRFCDLRKFGWIKVVGDLGEVGELEKLGPEPFDKQSFSPNKEFTEEYLEKIFSKTSRPIKLVLMDQEKIAGIGNIYANEALWEAKILPSRPAKSLTSNDIAILRDSILRVLEDGLKYGGSSAEDEAYIKPTGEKGSYQEHFRVYQRAGQKCQKCGGIIKRIELGGRGTFFCSRCQKYRLN